jgi:transmembrane sensor
MSIIALIDRRRREAGDWFAMMRGPRVSLADKRAFDAWLDCPANRVEYDALVDVWQAYEPLGEAPQLLQQVLEECRPRSARSLRRRRVVRGFAAMAATLMLAVATFLAQWDSNSYQTAVGEQRVVALPDGSEILLNTSTRIIIDYTEKFRRIELGTGELLANVAHDPERPFVVVAGDTLSRAVGTEFTVYRPPNGPVRISVLDGIVQVTRTIAEGAAPSQRRLVKGEVAILPRESATIEVVAVAPESISGWRTGKIQFDDVLLPEALAEINRYTRHNFVIGDQRLNNLRVSAVLNITDQKHFSDILERTFPIVALPREDNRIALMFREPS